MRSLADTLVLEAAETDALQKKGVPPTDDSSKSASHHSPHHSYNRRARPAHRTSPRLAAPRPPLPSPPAAASVRAETGALQVA